jgi:hypothetical protein
MDVRRQAKVGCERFVSMGESFEIRDESFILSPTVAWASPPHFDPCTWKTEQHMH